MVFFAILTFENKLNQFKVFEFMILIERFMFSIKLKAKVLKKGSEIEGFSFALMFDINMFFCVDLWTLLKTKL